MARVESSVAEKAEDLAKKAASHGNNAVAWALGLGAAAVGGYALWREYSKRKKPVASKTVPNEMSKGQDIPDPAANDKGEWRTQVKQNNGNASRKAELSKTADSSHVSTYEEPKNQSPDAGVKALH